MFFTSSIRTYLKISMRMCWEFYFNDENKNKNGSKCFKMKNISKYEMSFFSFNGSLWSYFIFALSSSKIISQKWWYITIISIANFQDFKNTHFWFQLQIHFLTLISKKSAYFSSTTSDEKLTSIAIINDSIFYESYSKKRINFEMFFE